MVEVSGGAVMAGETSQDAVKREVTEETGLDVSECAPEYLFSYKRDNPGTGDNYFVDVYRFNLDYDEKDIHLQTEETLDYKIVSRKEIEEIASQGKFLHYDSIKKAFE